MDISVRKKSPLGAIVNNSKSLFAAAVCTFFATLATAQDGGPVAQTTLGQLRGAENEGVLVFRGVMYGKDTSDYRFQPAQALDPWDGVKDALTTAEACPQVPTPAIGVLSTGFRVKWPLEPEDLSEDCLAMEIITPALDEGKRPVMVWLHGGGYAHGSGMAPAYDGSNMVRNGDIVHVSVNHRLNVFGFLYLADLLGEDYADSGSVGMLDIVSALEWIRDNIESFGGDPDNVTIFGQSGGGGKVSTLMAMPAADGLFHKAIVQSSSPLKVMELDQARKNVQNTLTRLGLTSDQAEELVTMPMTELMAVASRGKPFIRTTPIVDGRSLPRHPFSPNAPEISRDVPMIIGTTENERTAFLAADEAAFNQTRDDLLERLTLPEDREEQVVAAYEALYPEATPSDLFFLIASDKIHLTRAVKQATLKADQGGAPAYLYHVTWKTTVDGGKWRSPHMLEVPFVFDTVAKVPSLYDGDMERAQAMADVIQPMWIQFARTGDPNVEGLPEWQPFTVENKEVMIFDEDSGTKIDPFFERLSILSSN
jgi:para-nitrobenzyl esterase